ncbi:hypothetical protein BH762_gp073 [Gordonia phage OneUp]|uniref:Uncharacterized protein n=1 Tax=Gordonia phage OneUp TaxID=1838074 RepID=A0A160DES9_9CAUD|nr:hypothetical protein BH762_gp073 [Gordonia phage OneUp]ANA86446.1 hypothetical protein PBI_ONEUP_112 [Gordonia phage OneUp]
MSDPFRLALLQLPPDHLESVREQLLEDVLTSSPEEIVDVMMDLHEALAKMSVAGTYLPGPASQVASAAVDSVMQEAARLAIQRQVFREVLTIPGWG